MPGQLDLLARAGVGIKPDAGRTAPRFWIRRLVIWSAPGVIIREIPLRPGLNIVWSPDPADRREATGSDTALGHGSGKTLLCRLLRYLLGEQHFSHDEQRIRIAHAFPEGMVGAEVIVDNTQWAVLRPIGNGRKHYAVSGASLEQVLAGQYDATGIEPFIRAIEDQILTDDVAHLIPTEHPQQAWLITLAWLSRDQECRFDKVLDWRSPDSDSGSPARGLSSQRRLDALRALIGAIIPEEYRLRTEIDEMEGRHKEAEQEASRQAWEADRLRSRLIDELALNPNDIPPGRMAVLSLRQAAREKLAGLANVPPEVKVTGLDNLRDEADDARKQVEDLKQELAKVKERIPQTKELIRRVKGERPGLSVEIDKGEVPLCPICDVPIDRTLAEDCKLSHKLPDLEVARQRMEQNKRDLEHYEAQLQRGEVERDRLSRELPAAQAHADELHRHAREMERRQNEHSDAWFNARKMIDDADQLDQRLLAQEQTQASAHVLLGEIEKKRQGIAAFRDAQAEIFNELSRFFDAIIRDLLGPNASGRVTLDGNGLKFSIELDGERSTAAIDSLKVIAFDLAAMCMSIEGKTHQPAFLIHDSPREADLGLSVYHRLFHLVHRLERIKNPSLFQYIVTTTTRPSDEFLTKPWLCQTLGGAAEERLMRRDL
jgi:hypothetical protein